MRSKCRHLTPESYYHYHACRRIIRTSEWRKADDLFGKELRLWLFEHNIAKYAFPELAEANGVI